ARHRQATLPARHRDHPRGFAPDLLHRSSRALAPGRRRGQARSGDPAGVVEGRDMEPLADTVAEGRRIAEAAAERGIPLRVLGGGAIALTGPSARRPPLAREYADIDLTSVGGAKK